jgi:transposase
MDKAWVGVDAGKEFHWAHALDASGSELLSRWVENDEANLSALIDEVLSLTTGDLVWAIDQPGGGAAALLLALLWERGQRVVVIEIPFPPCRRAPGSFPSILIHILRYSGHDRPQFGR